MKSTTSKVLIVIAFLAVLILPVLESDKVGGALSPYENRYLAKFPPFFDETNNFSKEFKSGFETWLNDNLGGRQKLIRLSKTINFRFFGELGFFGYRVIKGPNGWLFYAPDPEIPYIVNSFVPDDVVTKSIKDSFERIADELEDSDISLVVAMFPSKFNVYPEELPTSLKLLNKSSAAEVIDEALKNADGFSYGSPFNELVVSKSVFPTYSRAYDIGHWNQYGAFIGYSALMKAAKQQIPDLRILTEENFTITQVERELKTEWGFSSKEIDLHYEPDFTRTAVEDTGFFERINYTSKDTWKSYRYYKNSDASLPRAILVGDSYVWQFLLNNVAESFSELVFIHYLDLDQVNGLLTVIEPDVVMLMGQGFPAVWALSQLSITNLSAEIISHDTPTTVERGESYNVNIVVRNSSDQAWSEDEQVRLCIFQDGKDFGYRINLPGGVKVDPGQEYTFVLYNFRVNDVDSTYLEYQMIKEGYQFFGEKERVDIVVE
ncbi:MAG TPA: hypothetical protein DD636_06650 [Anaerolineaceae bacterium]|jgi:hypothetical protein|nr:hypothetical protein [Anaerolineaceae bacterium]